jgi:hypothetical protein
MAARRRDDSGETAASDWSRTVHYGGRSYIASRDMAQIFESKANAVIADGDTELVPLLHQGGVDLLLISPSTGFTVVPIDLGVTTGRIPIVTAVAAGSEHLSAS